MSETYQGYRNRRRSQIHVRHSTPIARRPKARPDSNRFFRKSVVGKYDRRRQQTARSLGRAASGLARRRLLRRRRRSSGGDETVGLLQTRPTTVVRTSRPGAHASSVELLLSGQSGDCDRFRQSSRFVERNRFLERRSLELVLCRRFGDRRGSRRLMGWTCRPRSPVRLADLIGAGHCSFLERIIIERIDAFVGAPRPALNRYSFTGEISCLRI